MHRKLLSKKGIYCYDYMNSMERFAETALPSKEHFFNRLYDQHVSEEQYKYAGCMWETLKYETMRHYLIYYYWLMYLRILGKYHWKHGLDPIHYYSLPGLSWDAMLKYTGVELDLITDPDTHLMVEKSIRGGISNICHRHPTSNHPSRDTYKENEEPRTLYSWAMSQMLPLKGFKWTYNEIDILNVPEDSELGYILEVDLEYPKDGKHNPLSTILATITIILSLSYIYLFTYLSLSFLDISNKLLAHLSINLSPSASIYLW